MFFQEKIINNLLGLFYLTLNFLSERLYVLVWATSIYREGSSHVLLVPELGVSKTHAQISYDKEKKIYTITDLGSQNGTVLNGVPLTQQVGVKTHKCILFRDL